MEAVRLKQIERAGQARPRVLEPWKSEKLFDDLVNRAGGCTNTQEKEEGGGGGYKRRGGHRPLV